LREIKTGIGKRHQALNALYQSFSDKKGRSNGKEQDSVCLKEPAAIIRGAKGRKGLLRKERGARTGYRTFKDGTGGSKGQLPVELLLASLSSKTKKQRGGK